MKKFHDEVEHYLGLPITTVPEPISRKEVSDRIAEFAPCKADGPDSVSNTFLQHLPE